MFEEEAEEYANQSCFTEMPNPSLSESIDISDDIKDAVMFGYNKANEWHEANIPTSPINKVVLGYIKHYNSKLPCLVKWNGEWWYDARTYNDRVKLIAWKEIVLPKEIENA